jgi:hypothetical protein
VIEFLKEVSPNDRIGVMKRVSLALLVLSIFVLYAFPAIAQVVVPTPPGPVTALTPFTVVVGVLGAIAAILTNVKNSGDAPVTWLPYVTMGSTFLIAAVGSLTSSGSVNGVADFNAALAGIYALLGAASGSALHIHFTLPHRTKATIAAKVLAAKAATPLALMLLFGALSLGCATLQALIPEAETIENKIISDVQAGDTDVQVVNDVLALLGANATVEEASDIALYVLNELLESNLLLKHYPNAVANAQAVQAKLTATSKAHGAHKPSARVERMKRDVALDVARNLRGVY